MDRVDILDRLDKATDKAASFAIQRGSPISVSKKSVMIGNTVIEKNSFGTYDVLTFDKQKLFEDISVFDVAVIVAQRYNLHEFSAIKQVLALEGKFSKHHTDMIHYLHCMKSAKRNNDIDRMSILEDKFQMSELQARNTRDRISLFKRVK